MQVGHLHGLEKYVLYVWFTEKGKTVTKTY